MSFSVPDHAAAQRRKLFYADPGTTEDDRITYKEWDYGHWSESETYGGKLTENLTQAVGRDCLAFALDNLRRANYRVVFHVHDEVVIEYPSRRHCGYRVGAAERYRHYEHCTPLGAGSAPERGRLVR